MIVKTKSIVLIILELDENYGLIKKIQFKHAYYCPYATKLLIILQKHNKKIRENKVRK